MEQDSTNKRKAEDKPKGERKAKKQKKDGDKKNKKKGGFRLKGNWFFLTYSQIGKQGIEASDIMGALMDEYGVKSMLIALENHADGGTHVHALINTIIKVQSRDPYYFCIGGCQPNIQRPPSKKPPVNEDGKPIGPPGNPAKWRQEKRAYIMKDGNFTTTEGYRYLEAKIDNYKRRKEDFLEFKRDMERRNTKSPFPFKLPTGDIQDKPGKAEKKCNWMIVGDPDTGKSKWVYETFNGKKHYSVPAGKHPWDNYDEHELIIYDDVEAPREDVIRLTNIYPKGGEYCLPARYNNKALTPNIRRVVIILCNEGHEPSWCNEEAFQSRFTTIRAKHIAQAEKTVGVAESEVGHAGGRYAPPPATGNIC